MLRGRVTDAAAGSTNGARPGQPMARGRVNRWFTVVGVGGVRKITRSLHARTGPNSRRRPETAVTSAIDYGLLPTA
jgi:hypothetical protein